jgi:hypothetical protein
MKPFIRRANRINLQRIARVPTLGILALVFFQTLEIAHAVQAKTPPPVPVSQGQSATASSVWHNPGYEPARAFDGDASTRWSADTGQGRGWPEVDLGKPITVARIVIQEASYPQTARFAVEAQSADGAWAAIAEGTTIGAFKELKVTPVTAQKFRLHIFESKLVNAGSGMNIDEFQLFAK